MFKIILAFSMCLILGACSSVPRAGGMSSSEIIGYASNGYLACRQSQYERPTVRRTKLKERRLLPLSADESSFTYRLEHIIDHKVVSANMTGIKECIEIASEGKSFDIDFTTNEPCEIVRITGGRFGEVNLLELYDTDFGNGYSLQLEIPQNSGMGRVMLLTLRFSNGDEKEIGIW